MASVELISVRIIKNTVIEDILKQAQAKEGGLRAKFFKKLSDAFVIAAGGKAPLNEVERGTPDAIFVKENSILSKLLVDAREFEVKSVTTSGKGPGILSSVTTSSRDSLSALIDEGAITGTSLAGSFQRQKNRANKLEKKPGKSNIEVDLARKEQSRRFGVIRSFESAKEKGLTGEQIIEEVGLNDIIRQLSIGELRALVEKDTALVNDINRKINNLAVLLLEDAQKTKRRSAIYFFSGLKLNVNDLKISVEKADSKTGFRIAIGIKDGVFNNLIKRKNKAILNATARTVNTEFKKLGFNILGGPGIGKILNLALTLVPGGNTPISFKMNINSPIINLNFKGKDKRDVSRKKQVQVAHTQGRFISSTQFTALLKTVLKKQMPKGPIGGKPLSSSILTYRSGRFINSIQTIINFRQSLIKIFYNPIYTTHRNSIRDPDDLIEGAKGHFGIRQLTQQLFGRQFTIIRNV